MGLSVSTVGAGRKRGKVISGVTGSNTACTCIPARKLPGAASIRLAVSRGPSASSTCTTV